MDINFNGKLKISILIDEHAMKVYFRGSNRTASPDAEVKITVSIVATVYYIILVELNLKP